MPRLVFIAGPLIRMNHYVAGRRVPAVFNGMATCCDWIVQSPLFWGGRYPCYLSGYGRLGISSGMTVGLLLASCC